MRSRIHLLTLTVASATWIAASACADQPSSQSPGESSPNSAASTADLVDGFILESGGGEELLNGIVVKASPREGTMGSILVEQTFPRGGTTNLHVHDQGDELFYVVSGRGNATLGSRTAAVATGDVIFVGRGAVHRVENLEHDEPLKVVFFMDSPELVEQFRAMHRRVSSEPDRPITAEERAEIAERIGGARAVN